MKQIFQKVINIPKEIGKFLIKIYQFFLSFDHSFWAPYVGARVCIHEPSCSQYTYEAIDRFGLILGSIMGFFRVLRCNPMAEGGYDPVPNHFSIRRNKNLNS